MLEERQAAPHLHMLVRSYKLILLEAMVHQLVHLDPLPIGLEHELSQLLVVYIDGVHHVLDELSNKSRQRESACLHLSARPRPL